MKNLSILDNTALVIGRVLFVSVFCFQDAIYNKIIYANRSYQYITHMGLPMPRLLLILTVIFEIIAGVMIITGFKAKWGALFIFCFTLLATLIFHRFWTYAAPAEYQNQLNHFMKNLSIMGGALFIMVFGVGDFVLGRA